MRTVSCEPSACSEHGAASLRLEDTKLQYDIGPIRQLSVQFELFLDVDHCTSIHNVYTVSEKDSFRFIFDNKLHRLIICYRKTDQSTTGTDCMN